MESRFPAGEIYREHFDRGSAVLDPPPAFVDSMIDSETGRLRFGTAGGGLLTLPPHPHFPELVAGAVELTNELGGWLAQLPERAGAIARIGVADDRVVAAAKLIHEIETSTAKWGDQLRAKIVVMRDTATRLATSLREESDSDLPPEVARRLVDHFLALDDSSRAAFVRQATQAKDWRALRAIGTDPLVPYAARTLDRAELLDRAGAARRPRTAAMMAGYNMLADRLERNLPRITEATQKAVGIATASVDSAKLMLAQRAAASARPAPGMPVFPS